LRFFTFIRQRYCITENRLGLNWRPSNPEEVTDIIDGRIIRSQHRTSLRHAGKSRGNLQRITRSYILSHQLWHNPRLEPIKLPQRPDNIALNTSYDQPEHGTGNQVDVAALILSNSTTSTLIAQEQVLDTNYPSNLTLDTLNSIGNFLKTTSGTTQQLEIPHLLRANCWTTLSSRSVSSTIQQDTRIGLLHLHLNDVGDCLYKFCGFFLCNRAVRYSLIDEADWRASDWNAA